MLLSNISKNIEKYRKKLNLSQKELAEKLFVTHQAVSKWENGKSIPGIEIMVKMTELFSITIDDLLQDDPEVNFATALKTQDRNYCLREILSGKVANLADVFYLLNETERERVIFAYLRKELEIDIVDFWPLLSTKERLVILKGHVRNKNGSAIRKLEHMMSTAEKKLMEKENYYESKKFYTVLGN